MDIHRLYRFALPLFRRRRMRHFAALFLSGPPPRILDVGGAWANWSLLESTPDLVLSNLTLEYVPRAEGVRFVVADGCRLPFRDRAFDVVFSNSVIEHVGSREQQRRFASECRRVGASYFVQTPNRRFPIEPHFLTPFVHWLPRRLQRSLARNFTVRGWLSRPSQEWCDRFVDSTRMLDRRELGAFFPGAAIVGERFLGWTKSLIAISRGAEG